MEQQHIDFFEQRLSIEQREQVLSWFPELRYDDEERSFYDPDTSGFFYDSWFLESGELEDQETIHLCILMKNRYMVNVIYACPQCGNSWLDTYIRIPQDVSRPYVPQERVCDQCSEPVKVTGTHEYFQQMSDFFL